MSLSIFFWMSLHCQSLLPPLLTTHLYCISDIAGVLTVVAKETSVDHLQLLQICHLSSCIFATKRMTMGPSSVWSMLVSFSSTQLLSGCSCTRRKNTLKLLPQKRVNQHRRVSCFSNRPSCTNSQNNALLSQFWVSYYLF